MEEIIAKEDTNIEIDKVLKSVENDINEGIKEVEEDDNNKVSSKTPVYIIHTLNLLKNDSGIVFGDHASLKDVTFDGEPGKDTSGDNKEGDENCIAADKEQLTKWLTQHYEDFEMAFILALAVFEKLPCMWVYEIAEDLFVLMGGDKEETNQNRIRTPHQKRVKAVGGKIYRNYIYNHTGRVQEEFICFQNIKYAPRVLECVWDEFRYFREQLIGWLEKYISKTNYSKTIRAINALSKLLQYDFNYFERKAIKPLLDSNDYIADFAVAHLMLQILLSKIEGVRVEVSIPGSATTGNSGRADIVYEHGNIAEIYEIKPISYKPGTKYNPSGIAQLERYITNYWRREDSNNREVKKGTSLNPFIDYITVPSLLHHDKMIRYYTYPSDPGMIYWGYVNKPDQKKKDKAEENTNVIEKIDITAEEVAEDLGIAAIVIFVALVAWEIFKWVVAFAAAGPTAGGSLVAAGCMP